MNAASTRQPRRYHQHHAAPHPQEHEPHKGPQASCSGNEQTCWKCHQTNATDNENARAVFCTHCGTVQEPCSHCDFFQFFSCPQQFCIDEAVLASRYKELQKRLHPDKHVRKTDNERRLFESQSAIVNDAYRTLKEPYRRAAYLLKTQGIDVEGEAGNQVANMSPALLMEVMDIRERIDSSSQQSELQEIRQEYKGKLTQAIDATARAFGSGDLELAARQTIWLKYLSKIAEETENKLEELRAAG